MQMTIRQAIDRLKAERGLPARFHCRAILVRTIGEYVELLGELKKIEGARVVGIDELFSGPDVLPGYARLTRPEYQEQWLILPGVSEYLRLFHGSEEEAQRFGTLWRFPSDASSKGRILIPLWGCETLWFDKRLHLCGDERRKYDLLDCMGESEERSRLDMLVLSGSFEPYCSQLEHMEGQLFAGVQEWYHYWYAPQNDPQTQLLLTRRFASIRPTNGDVKIRVIENTLKFLREFLADGAVLSAENCPDEAQALLFDAALNGQTLDSAILGALNVQSFAPLDVMGRWTNLNAGERQLVFLWYELHPDETYLCHCVRRAQEPDGLGERVLSTIFDARTSRPEWVRESQELIAAMNLTRDEAYFNAVDALPGFEERLEFLDAKSPRERVCLLRMMGQWLRVDPEAALRNPRMKALYPELDAYLNGGYPDEAAETFFRAYKCHKLANTLPDDEENFLRVIQPQDYDLRYPALSEAADGDAFVLWIDALGAEWLPLLSWALEQRCDGDIVTARVTQAQLPSETRFNRQWEQMPLPFAKYDKLDKLAHKGVIDDRDYYACVEEQIRFVAGLAEKVSALLEQHGRVLITGDHGTSRLAARCFHLREGSPAPQGASVGSHGRYCRLGAGQAAPSPVQRLESGGDGERYLLFANYDHFSQSGFATGGDDENPTYGELHGGASPEEMLVPVIAVRSRREIPLTASWGGPGSSVKIRMKRAKCVLVFSRPVVAVEAMIGDKRAGCAAAAIPSKEWTLTFSDMHLSGPRRFDVSVLADGKLVRVEPIEIKPALGGNDPF